MENKKKYFIFLLCLFVLNNTLMLSQTTIGTDEDAVSGALLQIKNIPNKTGDEANANKGLLLPRVNLTVKNLLFPMFDGDSRYAEASQFKKDADNSHIGLIVYQLESKNGICKGLYCWDGEQWVILKSNTENDNNTTATTVTDRQGNVYRIATFGNAGTWMIENLRTSIDDCGDPLPVSITSDYTTPLVCYPGKASTAGTGPYGGLTDQVSADHPEYGLLYNWTAATKDMGNRSTAAGADQQDTNTGIDKTTQIQGICPKGWHLPSDNEWNDLEEAIATTPALYTANAITAITTPWENDKHRQNKSSNPVGNENWRTSASTSSSDQGYGKAMLSKTLVKNTPQSTVYAASDPSGKGFEALLVGVVAADKNGVTGTIQQYGNRSYFWTSSNYNGYTAWVRYLQRTNSGMQKNAMNYGCFLPVRCKKN